MKKALIITPSFSISSSIDSAKAKGFNLAEQASRAVNVLLSLGVQTEFGDLYYKSHFQNAGTKDERANELNNAYRRNDIHFIIPTQGGYNSIDLLGLIDYQNIEQNWKPLLGLSDITVLLNGIYAKTNRSTYHGYDFLWQIGLNAKEKSMQVLGNFFKYGQVQVANKQYNSRYETVKSGQGIGRIIGGCLSSYSLLLGTEFDPGLLNEDFIFFIEDIGVHYERAEALLISISLQPYFYRCKGLIIGTTYFCSYLTNANRSENQFRESIKGIFSDFDFPIVYLDDIGHISENRILPIGALSQLTVTDEGYSLRFMDHP